MWIMTPTSFVSIVAHRTKPNVLLVRCRLEGDIKRLFPAATVKKTPGADYRWRAEVAREVVAQVLTDQAMGMSYANVKGAIPMGTGKVHRDRSHAMHATWSVWNDLQQRNARPIKPAAQADHCECGVLLFTGETCCGQCRFSQ